MQKQSYGIKEDLTDKMRRMKKKGFLFTIATLLLFFSIFALTSVYLDRNKDLQYSMILSGTGDRLRYVEDDVISNVYSDLLGIKLNAITQPSKQDDINISFSQFLLAPGRDYQAIMQAYEDFVEGTYANKNNIEIGLSFSNNFTIEPYESLFQITGQDIYAYTLPRIYRENIVNGITVIIEVAAQNNSVCSAPDDDHSQNPVISVTFVYNKAGGGQGSCINTIQLSPLENNIKAGHQFYMETANPSGSIEVTYGKKASMDGVFSILASGISANVTQLNFEYEPLAGEEVILTGGAISMETLVREITKQSQVVLAQE